MWTGLLLIMNVKSECDLFLFLILNKPKPVTDISIFPDKTIKPTFNDVRDQLGDLYPLWDNIYNLVYEKYPNAIEEWNYPGKNYGWSFRIKDKKRAILYFLPRENRFLVAFVFGQKAYDEIMQTDIAESIKTDLSNAKKYAEGRGVRIEINDESQIKDIEKLIEIKLKY